MSCLSHRDQLQACFISDGPETDTSFKSQGTGKDKGEICPPRQLFDYEVQLPGTQLFEEANCQRGRSAASPLFRTFLLLLRSLPHLGTLHVILRNTLFRSCFTLHNCSNFTRQIRRCRRPAELSVRS